MKKLFVALAISFALAVSTPARATEPVMIAFGITLLIAMIADGTRTMIDNAIVEYDTKRRNETAGEAKEEEKESEI